MARSDGRDEIWGTWEELLLASAVSRHGTKDWTSVAVVVGERTARPHLLTADLCERRYRDLCRRFHAEVDAREIPWLDDLRKLRVAELRREVQRHDDSIVSLQLKVKELKEERERSLREDDDDARADEADADESRRKSDGDAARPRPDGVAAGERSGRSCNESNSPESKAVGQNGPDDGGEKLDEERVGVRSVKAEPATAGDDKAPGEGSCNGSSETVVIGKGIEAITTAADRAPARQPPDSGESMAESTGEDAMKDSSDVQSSASPSRRRKRKASIVGNSEGDSPEADELSPAMKVEASGKSEPLVVILEIVRSSKYGSVFERRLDSQDSSKYRSLIRQHMDLETVGKKLEEGSYTTTEFFRDLLLLCANAIVFFAADSPEHNAASHLRKLVNKELSNQRLTSLPPPPAPEPSASCPPPAPTPAPPRPAPTLRQPQSAMSKPKSEPDCLTSLLDKVPPTPPITACRKRSSLNAKNTKAAKEEAAAAADDKANVEKPPESVEKKAIHEKPVARGLRTTKTRGPMTKKPGLTAPEAMQKAKPEAKESSSGEPSKAPVEKSSGNTGGGTDVMPPAPAAKKRSAAIFLNRLKGTTSPSSNKESAKNNAEETGGSRTGGGETKKGAKEDRKKSKAELSAAVKRNVGRPPKRPAASSPPAQPSTKRPREAEGKRKGRR